MIWDLNFTGPLLEGRWRQTIHSSSHSYYHVTGTAFAVLCYLQYFQSPFGAHPTTNNEQPNNVELTSVAVVTII